MALYTRTLSLLILSAVLSVSCDRDPSQSAQNHGAQSEVPLSQKPVLAFDNPEHKFGEVEEGQEVNHEFTFTNNGKTDLLISNASASCGCTVPEWPKEPIPPGGKGSIKATFNTSGKSGAQNKKIVITANTHPELTEVFLIGDVRPKPGKTQP